VLELSITKTPVILCLLQEYIHRVGRTARGVGGQGHALLILRPEEIGFLNYLRQAKVPLNEFEFAWAKIANIQAQVRHLNGRW
jgi:ATP-dependent RNA helicase DDX18/HAS1